MRPLQAADAEAMAALIRAAFAALTVPLDPPPSALRVTAADILAHLATGGGVAIERDGALTGGLLWAAEQGGLHIRRLAVAPSARRQGLAGRMLDAAEAAARGMALPCLWLETRLALADNRGLFAAIGYREVSQHAHPGYAAPTFVRLEKRLAA